MTRAAAVICTMSMMAAAVPAGAAEWISLSDWAYTEVSGFVSEGLLPEKLDNVYDYTRPITRGEFTELLYSVLDSTARLGEQREFGRFIDCEDYPSVNSLDVYIYEGLACDGSKFLPEQALTREEAALILYNTMHRLGLMGFLDEPDPSLLGELISDAASVSGYAAKAVYIMVSGGFMTGAGSFEPQAAMTVEQAVAVMYRVYKWIPRLVYSDNELLDGSSELVQTYGNGLTELYRDGKYIISDNGVELMSFEEDVYTKLLSCNGTGRRLVFAVNFNDKTDVYDLDTGDMLCSIPYIVYKLDADKGHAYVYSSRFMPACSGLYSFDGTELIPPEYSEAELAAIEENGFSVPQAEYREADGMLYYTDDDGHLYCVDSNGENERLMTETDDCENLRYEYGMAFYNYGDGLLLGCIDSETNKAYELSDKQAELITNMQAVFYPNLAPSVAEQYIYRLDINGNTLTDSHFIKEVRPETMAFGDGFIIGESKMYVRTFVAENGSKSESTKYAYYLYDTRITASGVEKNAVGDIPATGICFDPACTKIYFLDADELYNNGDSPIYVYDGETVTELSPGLRAESFGYLYDTGGVNVDKFGYLTKDDIGGDTYHVLDLTDGSISEAQLVENVAAEYGDIPQGSSGVTEEGPVVMITADGVNISIDGETKLIEGVRDLYTIGDYVYLYEDEGRYGYGITTNMRPVTRRTLMAYNYKTGELIEISSDFSDSVWSFEDKFIYLTDSGQYKVVIGTECRSTAPNGGLFRYGEPVVVRREYSDDSVYKADNAGNVTILAENVNEWLYVPENEDMIAW